jgi:hypothetical protein
MFSKKSLHISLAFILVIALASLGLAYGFWSETLTIDGTVGTGDLDVDFVDENPTGEYDPSNSGTCTFEYAPDGNSIDVTITGAYPWYECSEMVKMVNNGSVSVVISGPTNTAPEWIGLAVTGLGMSPIPHGGSVSSTINIFVDETAPMNGSASFKIEFLFEQVH